MFLLPLTLTPTDRTTLAHSSPTNCSRTYRNSPHCGCGVLVVVQCWFCLVSTNSSREETFKASTALHRFSSLNLTGRKKSSLKLNIYISPVFWAFYYKSKPAEEILSHDRSVGRTWKWQGQGSTWDLCPIRSLCLKQGDKLCWKNIAGISHTWGLR